MVVDVQPISDIRTGPVDWNWLALKRVEYCERNELFWKLIGSVIVRAIRYEDRQTVGLVPGVRNMIRRRLASGIG